MFVYSIGDRMGADTETMMLTIRQPAFSLADLIDPNDTNKIFSEPRTLLAQWSRAIENAVIEQVLPAHIVVGFQNIRNIVPILQRYREIASIADSVTVVGLPHESVDLGGLIRTVLLTPECALCREWFLIVKHAEYARALIALDLTGDGQQYKGILTSVPTQVGFFYDAVTAVFQSTEE
jgi:hypothetical protein